MEDGLPFVIPFLGVIWILWIFVMAVFAVARVARTKPTEAPASAGGIQPFKSREEFLKARMEMDLGEWLDRAYVTPKEITRPKPSKTDVQLTLARQRLEEVRRRMMMDRNAAQGPILPPPNGGVAGTSDIGQMGWGSVGGVGGAASSGMAGSEMHGSPQYVINNTKFSVIDAFMRSGEVTAYKTAMPDVEIKVGCWYRVGRTGILVRCTKSFGDFGGYFMRSTGVSAAHRLDEVEIATPRVGETWTMAQCGVHAPDCPTRTYKITGLHCSAKPEYVDMWRRFALCGCSVPFEFGHGKI